MGFRKPSFICLRLSVLKESAQGLEARFLADFFSLSLEDIDKVLVELSHLKLVYSQNNCWFWSPGPEKTTDQVSSDSIRTYHKRILELAKNKLDTVAVEERDYSSIILTTDPEKIKLANEEIRKFRRKLATLLEDGEKRQVFALNIQFFPLSKISDKNMRGPEECE